MHAIRSIPIPSETVDALREHIGGRREGFVFTTKDGTQWNVDLVLKKNLREALKVTRGHLHMFRHRFATRQLHAGVPVAVVSKILGHGGISSTFNVSARVLAEHVEKFERQDAEFWALIGYLTRCGCRRNASRVLSMTRGGAAW